jgi:exosortase A
MTAAPMSAAATGGVDAASRAWRLALPLWLALLAWIAFWYRDTARAMWDLWMFSDTYAHGVLVVPISLWLAWRRREQLASLLPRPSGWALLGMAGAAAVWFLADLVVVNAASQFAFVALVVLSVPAVLGIGVARAMMFPLGFLFFAVPFGDFMLEPLMEATADFTVAALRLTGVPVLREGLQFVIPTGSWSVVQECSGVRYLIASVMVGSLFAYLNYRSHTRRWIFVGVSIVVPILANWLRAYMIVMLGHLSGNKIATGVDHLIYGWVFFGFVILIMFMIGMRWAEPDAEPVASPGAGRAATVASSRASSAMWAGLAGAVCVAVAPHLAEATMAAMERRDTPMLPDVAAASEGWRVVQAPDAGGFPEWKPIYLNPSAERFQMFEQEGRHVGLYLAYYRQQNAERKLISQANMLVHPRIPGWARAASGRSSAQVRGEPFDVVTADLRSGRVLDGASRLHVWRVYWVNGRWIDGDIAARLYGGLMRMLGRGDESAVMVIYARQGEGHEPDRLLQGFLDANLPSIEAALVAARDGPGASEMAAAASRTE